MKVSSFEVGKWYRYVGPNVRQSGWNSEGRMDFVLSGKAYKYISSTSLGDRYFLTGIDTSDRTWCWDSSLKKGFFEEVSDQEALKEKIEILRQEFSVIDIIKQLLFEERKTR